MIPKESELMSAYRVKSTFVRTTLVIGLVAGLAATLQGCVLAVGAAAGGSALVATDRRTLGAQTEDREIQVKAMSLISENLPDSAHVNVTVFNRRVLLTGEVAGEVSKARAESVVRSLNNVNSIVNELTIAPASSFSSRSNDTYLEGRVKTALIAEKDISANNYKVVCERGSVYLMGLVTRDEGNRGADVASRVPGVTQVVKVFQYIQPQEAAAATAAAASAASSAPAAAAQPDAEVTSGAVPDSSVTSKPLEQQAPAPVSNSTQVHPGNPKAGQ
jgi:osmotically-inducible protein OsmY